MVADPRDCLSGTDEDFVTKGNNSALTCTGYVRKVTLSKDEIYGTNVKIGTSRVFVLTTLLLRDGPQRPRLGDVDFGRRRCSDFLSGLIPSGGRGRGVEEKYKTTKVVSTRFRTGWESDQRNVGAG